MENRTTRNQFIDETGNIYGRWTVIRRAPKTARGHSARWLCRCVCGNERQIVGGVLRRGGSKSCGCLKKEAVSEAPRIDMIGLRFGRLVVVCEKDKGKCGATWECKCDCGNTTTVIGKSLRAGLTKSCGCFRRERISLPPNEAAFNSTFGRMKRQAFRRGYEWKLSEDYVRKITQQNCFYCGVEPSHVNKNGPGQGEYVYNGLDRVDNTKGYTTDNVVPCCRQCNVSKRSMSIDEFRVWILRVYENFMVKRG